MLSFNHAQPAGMRQRIRFVMIALAVTFCVVLFIGGRQPQVLTEVRGEARVEIVLDPGLIFLPGESVNVRWQTSQINGLSLNGLPQVGGGEQRFVASTCPAYRLTVIFRDETSQTYTVAPRLLFFELTAAVIGLAGLAVVVGWVGLAVPRWHSRTHTILIQMRQWAQQHRVLLVRGGLLASTLLLAFYAVVPACEMDSLLGLGAVFPPGVAAYLACLLLCGVLFVVSLWQPEHTLRLLHLPRGLLLLLVPTIWVLLLLLGSLWALNVHPLVVLPLALWFAGAGMAALLYNSRQPTPPRAIDLIGGRRVASLIVGLALWVALWLLPRSIDAAPLPLVRTGLAVLAFSLVGGLFQQMFDTRLRLGRLLTVGFVVAVALTGGLGLLAQGLRLPIQFVTISLFLVGAAALIVIVRRGTLILPPVRLAQSPFHLLTLMSALLLSFALGWLAFSIATSSQDDGDYSTYNAFITAYAHADALDFTEVLLGTDQQVGARFWFVQWYMAQAVMVNLSDLHIYDFSDLSRVVLVGIALLSVYQLGRALGLSPLLAWFAVVGQALAILLLTPASFIYDFFVGRLDQDKALLAFVGLPVILRLLVEFFAAPSRARWLLLSLSLAAAMLIHGTIYAIAAAIIGLYSLLEWLLTRRWQPAVTVLVVLAACTAPLFAVRFFFTGYATSVVEAQERGMSRAEQRNEQYITTTADPRFYGLAASTVDDVPHLLLYAGAAVALFRLRRQRAARFVVVATGLLLLAVFPYTGWLLGIAITPFYLWRIPLVLPYGIALAVLLDSLMIPMRRRSMRLSRGVFVAVLAVVTLVGAASALEQVQRREQFKGDLRHLIAGDLAQEQQRLRELMQIGQRFDAVLAEPTVILGYPEDVRDYLPGLARFARTLAFRDIAKMSGQGSIPPDEARQRMDDYAAIVESAALTDEQRWQILRQYQIGYLLVDDPPDPLDTFIRAFPDRLVPVLRGDWFDLYRVDLSG
jgi:hypothetical protein